MKILSREKGFTLIELLVVVTIIAAISGAISAAIITIIKISPKTNDWATALRQVQNAGYWISRDVETSRGDIDINPSPDTFLTLTVPQWDDVQNEVDYDRTIDYKFQDIDGEQWLTRIVSIGESVVEAMPIAEYIDYPPTASYSENCTDNCTLTFTIEAASGDAVVTKQYEAQQRIPQ